MGSERLERLLDHQLGWVEAADSKIPSLFAIDTAMLGVLAALATKSPELARTEWIVLLLAAMALLVSISALALGAIPRTRAVFPSLIYFGGISAIDFAEFSGRVNDMSDDEYDRDLIGQIYANAVIASIKYLWVRRAYWATFVSVVPWLLVVVIIYPTTS